MGAMTAASMGKINGSSDTTNDSTTAATSDSDSGGGVLRGHSVEDLAMSLLMSVTLNIGQLAVLSAQMTQIKRSSIYFTGSWLSSSSGANSGSGDGIRDSEIVSRRLAWSVDVWSGHTLQAVFLDSNSESYRQGRLKALGAWVSGAAPAEESETNR